MLISEIISLPVISIFSGKLIGTIENVLFDSKQKKCLYIVIFNENDDLTFVLKSNKIFKIGNECLFIKNETCLDLYESEEMQLCNLYNPISTKVYSLDCKYIGTISDIEIDNSFNITYYIINNDKVDNNKIINFSNTISIYSVKAMKLSNFKTKNNINKKPKDAMKVSIENKEISLEKPKKIITNYSFLINRILVKNIQHENGEILIKSGTKINLDIINKAKTHGKLIELTHYSI